jgi:hypothetical protein
MSIVNQYIDNLPMDERVFFDWQFSLSTRLCQIMEERKISKQEFAQLVNISEAELDDLIHFCADPPLSLMARIAAFSNAEILKWVDTDVVPER